MAIGDTTYVNSVREQLLSGRARLSDVIGENESAHMLRLLEEVDSALHRIDQGRSACAKSARGRWTKRSSTKIRWREFVSTA